MHLVLRQCTASRTVLLTRIKSYYEGKAFIINGLLLFSLITFQINVYVQKIHLLLFMIKINVGVEI